MGVKIDTNKLDLNEISILNEKNKKCRKLRSAAFSPRFKKIVGIAMININFRDNKKISIKINRW